MSIRKFISVLIVTLIIVVSLHPAVFSAAKLTILTTNDHHGHFMANRKGEYGMAARMTLVEKIRREVQAAGGHLLLLSGGDINTGTPESDYLKAEPDIKAMNLMEYTAMAVGNHEFDKGFEVLRQQRQWANFPLLSANIFWEENLKPAFKPYVIKKMGTLCVAIVGLTTTDTPVRTRRENVAGLIFKEPVSVIKDLMPTLKQQSDMIIVLSHMGYYEDGKHGIDAPGDVTLARKVEGIDFIAGGHTHEALISPAKINNTLIVQAGNWGRYLSRTDLEYSRETGTILKKYQLIPINLENTKTKSSLVSQTADKTSQEKIPPNEKMATLLAPYSVKIQKQLQKQIGSVDGYFEGNRDVIRKQETNLGNLVTYAMASIASCDIGIQNSGGIRDSLEKGAVTLRDLIKIDPFGNTISQVTLTGDELKTYLEKVLSLPAGHGSFAQTWGISATLEGKKMVQITVDGQPVVDTRSYSMALNNFIATGGDGYPDMSEHFSYVDTGYTMNQAITDLFENRKTVSTSEFKVKNSIKRF